MYVASTVSSEGPRDMNDHPRSICSSLQAIDAGSLFFFFLFFFFVNTVSRFGLGVFQKDVKREWLLVFSNKIQTLKMLKKNAVYYDSTQHANFWE